MELLTQNLYLRSFLLDGDLAIVRACSGACRRRVPHLRSSLNVDCVVEEGGLCKTVQWASKGVSRIGFQRRRWTCIMPVLNVLKFSWSYLHEDLQVFFFVLLSILLFRLLLLTFSLRGWWMRRKYFLCWNAKMGLGPNN